ncbi:IclR family transcriptional regulator [Plasticicumulans acidivorans]|uniref:IclR family transcriptional regulator n=1 Tax=Plasticicumulans acidivorans TaxID=886464 RepID=A0A317MNI4_9GAMM|nr:IclR family transcriptional regulator [Plasticicumulans acidivorans]PWV57767.1 IclR family transcriptional regulator [Plasticicumulans acidivorans]
MSRDDLPAAQPETDEELEKDRQFVTALARGLEVLRCFRPGERLLGNQDLVARTGLPKATVSRLSYTLTKLGYLSYSESLGKYALGTGVLSLGYALLSNLDIRQAARPLMQELAEHSQASVSIGARDRLEMVYVENCRSSATVTLRLDVGSRLPIATTAMGRAFLAALPEREREYLLDHIRARNPQDWPRIRQGVDHALIEYQERGYCLSLGDWQKDVHAVGVPLIQPDGSGIYAFNCGGPAFQIRRHMLEDDLGPRLVNLVRNVEAATGRHLT